MPPKTKKPPTVADVMALWRALPPADQAKLRRLIDKRRSRWDTIDSMLPRLALVYDIYREKFSMPPTAFFRWLGRARRQDDGRLFLFGANHDAAWRRLYRKYKAGDYEKLPRPSWVDDPALIVLPPPAPSEPDPCPPALGFPPVHHRTH
jgi:hypothetical protein